MNSWCTVSLYSHFFSSIRQMQKIWSVIDLLYQNPHWWSPIISSVYGLMIEINLVNGRFVARPHGSMQSRRLTKFISIRLWAQHASTALVWTLSCNSCQDLHSYVVVVFRNVNLVSTLYDALQLLENFTLRGGNYISEKQCHVILSCCLLCTDFLLSLLFNAEGRGNTRISQETEFLIVSLIST
jgi:hypothetical protein